MPGRDDKVPEHNAPDAGIDDGAGRWCRWRQREDVEIGSHQGDAVAGGLGDGIGFRLERHRHPGVAIGQPVVTVINTDGQSVVTSGEDAPVPNADRSHLGGGVLAPGSNQFRQLQVAAVPVFGCFELWWSQSHSGAVSSRVGAIMPNLILSFSFFSASVLI